MLCHDTRGDNSQKLFRLHFQLLPRQSAGGYREGERGQLGQFQLLLVSGNQTQMTRFGTELTSPHPHPHLSLPVCCWRYPPRRRRTTALPRHPESQDRLRLPQEGNTPRNPSLPYASASPRLTQVNSHSSFILR